MSGTILTFVEGQSEEEAVPILLRRLLDRFGRPEIQIARPFRVKRLQVVRPGELERALRQGTRDRTGVSAVLVLLDADDADPFHLEASLLARCRETTPLPAAVIAAQRELEAWFLGSKDTLRGFRGIEGAFVIANPVMRELVGDARESLGLGLDDHNPYAQYPKLRQKTNKVVETWDDYVDFGRSTASPTSCTT